MSTALVVVNMNTTEFNYGMAMVFFIVDMRMIQLGTATTASLDSSLMNEYINKAIASMH